MMIISPLHMWRKTHQDAFNTPIGPKAKQGTFIVHQIEFHITTSPDLLPFPVVGLIGHILPGLYNRLVGLEERIPHFGYKAVPILDSMLLIRPEVVKE